MYITSLLLSFPPHSSPPTDVDPAVVTEASLACLALLLWPHLPVDSATVWTGTGSQVGAASTQLVLQGILLQLLLELSWEEFEVLHHQEQSTVLGRTGERPGRGSYGQVETVSAVEVAAVVQSHGLLLLWG